MYMYSRMHAHKNRVLTHCGCAGCDGRGVMKDVRKDIQCTCMYSRMCIKIEYLHVHVPPVAVQAVMDEVS